MKKKEIIKALDWNVYSNDVVFDAEYDLSFSPYHNSHSWAGSQGHVYTLLRTNGDVTPLAHGGWYSDNGNITEDITVPSLGEQLQKIRAQEGDYLCGYSYNHMDKASNYDSYTVTKLSKADIEAIRKIVCVEDEEY